MQPYLYAAGNPLRYTDPSGEIIPFLIAAGLGGLIAGGIDLGTQLLAMHPQSLSQALRCVNWGQVGIAFAGGAVAGLTGVYLSPQPFKKVLNFALISRNRLIKLI